MAVTTQTTVAGSSDAAYDNGSATGANVAQQSTAGSYPGSVPGRPEGKLSLESKASTQFGTAPSNFLSTVDQKIIDLAKDMGLDETSETFAQDVYNLLALMRVSGGNDGFFGSGDVVAGALTLGMELNDQAIGALQKFSKENVADGDKDPSTGKMSMEQAFQENTNNLTQWGAPAEIIALKPGSPVVKQFHQTVKELGTDISTGNVGHWVEKHAWLGTINLMELGFDWDELNIAPPSAEAKAKGNDQIDAANARAYSSNTSAAEANAMATSSL